MKKNKLISYLESTKEELVRAELDNIAQQIGKAIVNLNYIIKKLKKETNEGGEGGEQRKNQD